MKSAATATFLAAALLVAACGGSASKSSAPPPAASTEAPSATTAPSTSTPAASAGPKNTCLDVPLQLVRKLQTHLVLSGGRLTHLQAVTTSAFPGIYFVSARVDGGGAKHMVATWATQRLAGGAPVWAVDGTAALISLYGGARTKIPDLHADGPGAYKSRVCSAGPSAPHGVDAPIAGGGAPATK